jgi:hypothetical protein
MEKFKEALTKLPPPVTLLKFVTMFCGGLLAAVGLWLLVVSLLTFGISGLLIGFYLM